MASQWSMLCLRRIRVTRQIRFSTISFPPLQDIRPCQARQKVPINRLGWRRAPRLRRNRSELAANHLAAASKQKHETVLRPGCSETVPILNPRFSDDKKPLLVAITDRAAQRLSAMMVKDDTPLLVLRITVESGGCHGFQYLMKLEHLAQVSLEDDTLFVFYAQDQIKSQLVQNIDSTQMASLASWKPKVVMDSTSLELLDGSKIDYTVELIGSQFKIVDNPRATSSCGCGTSFDVNL